MSISFAEIQASRPGSFSLACPTRTVLDHVMSRWGVLVLCALSNGTRRWSELRREVDGISEKMLASTLRTLTADGIISRTALATVPPHVEYCLTDTGRELMERMLPLIDWISANADDIVGDVENADAVIY
ncbi:DNA-binding HxlR family transcriptional regulator [Microbacterium halimionae]|uniref:DNA-binding HxlR family transcriptional regulator n=1 Tax=Microbacterium halimionae TaxID=1526413 RepID=A0A7W3JQF4_9MICO|nr:helix-turn-helix domain-containing protein [Microbacterium halimionae]MBA8817120.1 DNA-binding HxlR family transcriptional regulator [Microbacterium halimionae]NII94339.1 DNA-binding HxlR family transcriptional regulator [Microbacterium halimionae]